MNNIKGIALVPTLTISLIALVLGFAAMYVSEMGYRSISAEARWQILEKVATGQAKRFAADVINSTRQCGTTLSGSFNGVNFNVISVNAGGSCFIWSSATMANGRVTKVLILTQSIPNDYGAAVFREIHKFSISGSSSISSCDESCPIPALISGKSLNISPGNLANCRNNPNGITALVDPYVVNQNLLYRDLTSVLFKNLQSRGQMLNRFTQSFNVKFDNGRPVGVNNPDCSPSSNVNNCTAQSNSIECDCSGQGNNRTCQVRLTWNQSQNRYSGTIGGNSVSCSSVDLGQNATVTFSNFTGGGVIGANQVKISGDINNNTQPPTLTVIARDSITDGSRVTIVNVNMFAKNYTFSNQGLNIQGGIIYSGGARDGNLNINLNSDSKIGASSNPTLIVSDNNINIQRNGNAEINGIIFATYMNDKFNISGNGNFSINGMVMSNSLGYNSIDISGNFLIKFNKAVIQELANRYDFINPPRCGSLSARNSIIQTLTTVY